MRKKVIAGNWKMNKNLEESQKLATELVNIIKDEINNNAQIVICAPFTSLYAISSIIKGSKIALGAQNCYTKNSGAYTGEISTEMLKSVGVSYVIIGHSERREYFTESNAFLAEKINAVLAHDMTPIFCCGETLSQREQGIHIDFVNAQLSESLFHLSDSDIQKVVIAYEPIWAIGTGVTASTAQAQEMHELIRKHIASKYGNDIAEKIIIQYGGSMKPENAKELLSCKDVDGGLIGGASLKARDFVDIIKNA
ncbi:MAG: triose-phosphate isomerase [Cytophagales bacterium]|nr:MAG: triose-phosphate isomerase [Cytophagales bacterium]